jgi:hypothetical protein
MAMGEAAGLAAALALKMNLDPAELLPSQLKTALLEQAVVLEPIPVEIDR